MKKISQMKINPMSINRVFSGRKYQFMGLYPNSNELRLDLERLHRKYGFILKFEKDAFEPKKMEVWKRKK